MKLVRSSEYLEKQRLAHLGKRHSPETIRKLREFALSRSDFYRTLYLGRKHAPATCEKLRIIGLTQSAARRERMLGKTLSEETKEKLRQAALGRHHTPESREKLRQAALGRHHTIETRKIMSEKARIARLLQRFPTQMTIIEQLLHDEFKKRRLKFVMHQTMFEKYQPDFVFEEAQLIVQADGDYWHSRPEKVFIDFTFNARAVSEGWTVMRFSEAVIKTDPARCAKTVAKFVRSHATPMVANVL